MSRSWRAVAAAVVAAVLQSAAVTTGTAGQDPPIDPGGSGGALASSLGLVQGLLVLWLAVVIGRGARRRRTAALLAAGVCAVYAVQAGFAGVVPPAAPWVALVLVGTTAVWRVTAACLALLAGGFFAGSLARPASAGTVPLLVMVTAVVVLATALSVSRAARAAAVAAQKDEALRRQASQERIHLARELHDSIGHGLSVVSVQGSAARMALQAGDEAMAIRSLAAVEAAARSALAELRHLVHVLRDPEPSLGALGTLPVAAEPADAGREARGGRGDGDLAALVVPLRDAGFEVDLIVDGEPLDELPATLRATVYRIVQEGLTNVVRHAPGAATRVHVTRAVDEVAIDVANGPPRSGDALGGQGLAGLRERAALLGGTVQAGPSGQGWLLEARLPAAVGSVEGRSGVPRR